MDRDAAEPDVDSPPGPRARELVEHHSAVAADSTYVYPFVYDPNRPATGPFCRDVDDNTYLDFASHVASTPLGYRHPRVVEKLEEFGVQAPSKIAGQDFYSCTGWPPDDPDVPGPTQLMDRLTEITSQYGFDTVFLSNSGAEAVENAIKIAYAHTGGSAAVTFKGAFHGRTLGALSLNRSKGVHRRGFPEVAGVHDAPFCRDSGCTSDSCGCGFFREDGSALKDMVGSKTGYLDQEDLAFVVAEPVQGEGGLRVPSEAFAREVQRVCDENDAFLVVDEVQTGVGRTGEWWGSDHLPWEPDVIAAGKALQVGATVASEEVFPDERGRLSSTWGGGDLVASLQGEVTVDVIQEEGLMDDAVRRGRQLRESIEDVGSPHVDDVRGRGLMVGVELDSSQRLKEVVEGCFRRGLLTLPCGDRTLRLLPPLDVRAREVEIACEVLSDSLEAANS